MYLLVYSHILSSVIYYNKFEVISGLDHKIKRIDLYLIRFTGIILRNSTKRT